MAEYNPIARIYTSAKYGVQQAIQSYRAENFVAEIDYDWESQNARMARYWHNRRYVDNTIYQAVNRYAAIFKFQEKLYKHIRGLYNPTGRLVDIEASKILGGSIDYEEWKDGALMLGEIDERLEDAIRTIAQWSHMDSFKTRYVRDGASMGDVAIKLVDDIERQKIRMEVLDPRKVPYVEFDSIGNVKYTVICYEKRDPLTGQWYEYKEEISKDSFKTYRNGEPFDYQDMSSAGASEWDNPYGFVPLRWVKHRDVGLDFGAVSFHNSRHKIDMVNDALSLLLHNVRMQVQTKFSVSKVTVPRDSSGNPTPMAVSSDDTDKAPFIEIGEGSINPIVFPVAVHEALELAAVQMREIEADLPQLALTRMRQETGNMSGVGIKTLYNDSVDNLKETQTNYLYGLKSALQMGISMGAYRGYPQFRAFSLNSYEAGNLDFDFKPKPIIPDDLSKKEIIELTLQAAKSEATSLVLPMLDYSEEQIEELQLAKDERARLDVRAAFGDLMNLENQDPAMQTNRPESPEYGTMMEE